jgi:hypothetical protein
MTPWFIATERFRPIDGDPWRKYIEWSGLTQLTELVSLDSILCPSVLRVIRDEYWPNIVCENYMTAYFTDLDFLKKEVVGLRNFNLLCVLRNPATRTGRPPLEEFEFVGYDLVEAQTGVSALTNCGGFPDVFANSELSRCGLLTDFVRAAEVNSKLRSLHPEEAHANCDLWAVFRAIP